LDIPPVAHPHSDAERVFLQKASTIQLLYLKGVLQNY